MFGKLTLDAVPYHEPIIVVTVAAIIIGGLALLAAITYFGKWSYLWNEWLTSVDHKRLGIMYVIVAIVMLLRGFADAIMMRSQQVLASAGEAGFLPPHHYDQIFTAHGVIMIFFVAMPFVIGLMNLVVPLQLGARDVAFPFLNNLSFWFTVVGVILVNLSLGVGEFAQTGWLAYPPLSGIEYSPGVGVDYWIWALQLSGIGTTLTGINFFVTIIKMRAPGMTMFKMPVFSWASLCANILIIALVPNSDRHHRAADPGSLPGHPFLYQRYGWQHDDVHQPDLGLGSPGSVHPGSAGVRGLLRNRRDLLA
ncbi:cytochrome O ubiquinol oxidase subunit I [Klebsiella pneumoniae]|uniref:Cytochrome O ubiquinol oxidase subunit I n=1 Tax=Klebsiella pneumoniae TaxID=573 RepID=A0A4P0XRA1_KLEPN|nr:cytochrome O ubiquinol oxidase subunit I [Klebsiella pneumoniae]